MCTKVTPGVRRRSDAWVPFLVVIVILGLVHDGTSGRLSDWNAGELAVFSRRTSVVDRDDFRSGDVVAIFGSNRMDVRRASFADSIPTVGAVAVFGQVELIVPPGSRITGDRLPFMGSVRVRTENGSQTGPTIRVNALALFGTVIVRN